MAGMGRAWGGRRNIFYTATAAELTAASPSRVFPRSLHLPISAGGEVPVWPPAAGRLSRGGEAEGAAQAQLELLSPRHQARCRFSDALCPPALRAKSL